MQDDAVISPLGQTPAIVARLRRLDKNRAISFRQRVDAFTGQHPNRMQVAKRFQLATDNELANTLGAAWPKRVRTYFGGLKPELAT